MRYSYDRIYRTNWLNYVGHKAVVQTTKVVYGEDDAEAAHLGCMLYEVLTEPALVGDDFNKTPNYLDAEGTILANELAYNLKNYDRLNFVPFSDYTRSSMERDAGGLCELTDDIVVTLRENCGDRYRLMARTGAALLRNLHVEAQQRINAEAA